MSTIRKYLYLILLIHSIPQGGIYANTPIKSMEAVFNLEVSDTILCPDGIATVTVTMPGVKNGFFSYTHLGFAYSKSVNNGSRVFTVNERGRYTITSYGEVKDDGSISTKDTNLFFTISYHRLPNATVSGGGVFCRYNTTTPLVVNLTGTAPWNISYKLNDNLIVNSFSTSPAIIADENTASINLVSVSDKNCSARVNGSGSLEIIEIPDVELIGDLVFCPNSIADYQLTYDPGYKYTWAIPDGATHIPQEVYEPHKTTIRWDKPGTYNINYEVFSIKNNCTTGKLSESILVHQPPHVKKNYDTIVCFRHKDYVELVATQKQENTVYWVEQDSYEHPLPIVDTGLFYYIEKIPFGCADTGDIKVHEKCIPEIFVPEAFTPNNDGVNDALSIYGNFFDLVLEIYTANGQLIYTYRQYEEPWDGKIEGADANNGVYYWKANFNSELGEPYYNEGQFMLIR